MNPSVLAQQLHQLVMLPYALDMIKNLVVISG
jgi:hypothetical protein